MRSLNFIGGVVLLTIMGAHTMQAQTVTKLSLDTTKPIVYIEFDHSGPRQPVEDGEPTQGLWLRLVNNSVIPIEVRANGSATDPKMTILPDVITPRKGRIPKSGPTSERMPSGYASDTATLVTVGPGKDLVFSVPANHVAPTWFMQVPFQFSLPPVQEGVQPLCYAEFTWEDLPESYRTGSKKHPTGAQGRPAGTLLHESSHVDPPPQQDYGGKE